MLLKVILFTLIVDVFTYSNKEYNYKCPEIVSKTQWGARAALVVYYLRVPVEYVIIHHTVTDPCNSFEECSEMISDIQSFHMDEMEFDDIGYNFLVGGDGRIYEGVGYHKVGSHTYGYNSKSLGIAFIGNFTSILPNEKQMAVAKKFLSCSVEIGELDTRYKLLAARQVSPTKSPGLTFYRNLTTWSHFTSKP